MRHLPQTLLIAAATALLVPACSPSEIPGVPETLLGQCTYINRFSSSEECREFRGDAWTEEEAAADCADRGTSLIVGGACDYPSTLGACILEEAEEKVLRLVMPGDDPSKCRSSKRGCELFGGGVFIPSPLCGGSDDDYIDEDGPVFLPPELICMPPVDGEAEGASADGEVCTWSMISGCTEPGRRFNDYASCEQVRTQRPSAAVPPPAPAADPDPRMDDPSYVAELAWVTEQVEACACVCCHQTSITPDGASVWDIEGGGNWMNTFSPYGLAFAGGFVDSSLLGAYAAADNNGFDRQRTGIPSTDPERMIAFFADELASRGFSPEDWDGADPTPAPFHQQNIFEPDPCADGEGVAADGTITWRGGGARYLYVLTAGSKNPGVPPNLDVPAGTLWKVDVDPAARPLASGEIRYGVLPEGTSQAAPASGSPAPLVSGETYYIYAAADVMIPITRCLFTAK